MKSILVIGDSCTDEYVYGYVHRICPEAPVPCFDVIDKTTQNLGMASNVKNNISSMLNAEINIITNKSLPIKRRFIDNQYNRIVFRADINDACERIDRSVLRTYMNYEIVCISDYCKGFLSIEDIEYITKLFKDSTIFLDTKKKFDTRMSDVDYIKINHNEFVNNFSKNVEFTKEYNTKLIVTHGSNGAYLYEKGKQTIFPTQKSEIIDVCGAGDTFFAGLIASYAKGLDIEDSIRFANHCASEVVKKLGVCSYEHMD